MTKSLIKDTLPDSVVSQCSTESGQMFYNCANCSKKFHIESWSAVKRKSKNGTQLLWCSTCKSTGWLTAEMLIGQDANFILGSQRLIGSNYYIDKMCTTCNQPKPHHVEALRNTLRAGKKAATECSECKLSRDRYVDKEGYVRIKNNNKYVAQHRLVMSEYLGRELLATETVHHINGVRNDNRIENLQLRQGAHGQGQVVVCLDCHSHRIGFEEL